jgi:hypothetical protein
MTDDSKNTGNELDEILAGLANYIVESIQLQPTPVEYRKLNQKQAKRQIQELIDRQTKEARKDQIMLDFLAYNKAFTSMRLETDYVDVVELDVNESLLVDIRDEQLATLQAQSTKEDL